MQTGIQVSSFKSILTTPKEVREAFRRIARMNCRTVQLQWIDRSVSIGEIASALQESSLQSVSVQDLYDAVIADEAYYTALNAATGGTWLCVSRIPERFKSKEGLDAFACELAALESRLTARGQRLCFHPVSADFEPVESLNPVEYLLDRLPGLPLCLDLYHINKRRLSMTGWIRRYAGRIPMVHFKDEKDGSLVPAGQGDTDWTGVAAACAESGVSCAFVEQEKWNGDPFICLNEALDWLNGQIPVGKH